MSRLFRVPFKHVGLVLAFSFWATCLPVKGIIADDPEPTPLADAAEKNNGAELVRLLEGKPNVNQAQADEMTALHWTVFHSNQELTRKLLAAGANAKARNRYGIPPLTIACTNGDTAIVKMLLDAGADPNSRIPGGETALMTAARTGKLGPVKELIGRKVNIDAQEQRKQTALMWAAAEGNLEVVDALLKAGANYQTPLASGFTPLFFAVREGRTAVALRLLNEKLDIDAPMKRAGKAPNPLLLAVENGHYETAIALLDAGADPNAQPAGHGALHAISWVRKPIRGDGNPSPVGSGRISDLQFIKAMVTKGADINLKVASGKSGFADFTTTGATPFVLAARTGDIPLMKTLLSLKADPTLRNADQSTALLAACGVGDLGSGQQAAGSEQEAIEAAKLLLKLGADVNAVDKNGETAIHGAAYQNWPQLIRFLANSGADVKVWNRKNRWGWTPLRIARGYRKGNFRPDSATIEIVSELMKAAGAILPPPPKRSIPGQKNWPKKKTKERN